jgi:hypothetical protein
MNENLGHEGSPLAMSKIELIDAITTINPGTSREFLAEFSERDLLDYLRQLDSLGLVPAGVRAPDWTPLRPKVG